MIRSTENSNAGKFLSGCQYFLMGLEFLGALFIMGSTSLVTLVCFMLSRIYVRSAFPVFRALGEFFSWILLVIAGTSSPFGLSPAMGYLVSSVGSLGMILLGFRKHDEAASEKINTPAFKLTLLRDFQGATVSSGKALLAGLVTGVLVAILGQAFSRLTSFISETPAPLHPMLTGNTSGIILFLSLVLAVPVIEEIIFRGLIAGSLRGSFSLNFSMIMSSFIFALVHNPIYMPGVFLCGVLLAAASARYGLLASITGHSLNNLLVFWLLQSC